MAALGALAAAALPAPALADDPPAPADAQPPAQTCLAPKGQVDGMSIRGVRVGARAQIRDADGKPLAVPGSLAAPTWQALYVLHWDPKYAYWFRLNPEETHLVLDSKTGKLLREQSLIKSVDYRQWDPNAKQYIVHTGVNLREMHELSPRNKLAPGEVIRVMPAWHCNIVINGYHYFLTSTAHRRNGHAPKGRGGPSHCIARVNVEVLVVSSSSYRQNFCVLVREDELERCIQALEADHENHFDDRDRFSGRFVGSCLRRNAGSG